MTIYLVMQQHEHLGCFPTLGQSGIALFNLNDQNSDSDLTRQILSELRNGISEKALHPQVYFQMVKNLEEW